MNPDFQDMRPFDRWWATKGWWLGRKLDLDEETMKKIWEEGWWDGKFGSGHRNREPHPFEDLGDLR